MRHETSRLLQWWHRHSTTKSATLPKYLNIFERMTLHRPYKARDRCATNTTKPCGNLELAFPWAAVPVAGERALTFH